MDMKRSQGPHVLRFLSAFFCVDRRPAKNNSSEPSEENLGVRGDGAIRPVAILGFLSLWQRYESAPLARSIVAGGHLRRFDLHLFDPWRPADFTATRLGGSRLQRPGPVECPE